MLRQCGYDLAAAFAADWPMGARWILLAAVLWSSGGLVIQLVPLSGLAITAGRALVTVGFFAVVVRPKWRSASWLTALSYAGMIASFVLACKLTSAAQAIVLQYSGTAWVLLAGPRILGEPLRLRDVLVAAVALAAMALCAQDTSARSGWHGTALGVFSGLCYAATVVSMRLSAGRKGAHTPEGSILLGNVLACVACLPWSAGELYTGLDWPSALGLTYLGVVQIGAAYWAFARGLRTVSAATAALLALAEPVLTPVWVWLGTRERPSTATATAGLIVVAALAARAWADRRS
ncbi:MAG: DMT family transporter [Myxococcales bacterium]|nr:DMT family transporter [Myxococcales bacterium]